VLNNSLAAFGSVGKNVPAPGRRMTSSMAPTLVSRGEKLELVLGTPGGDTIASTLVQLLRHLVDHGMTLDDAVDAPRLHHGLVPDEVRWERRRPPPTATLDALEALGHRLSKKRIPMGHANSILLADGVAWGYVDPREGGLAAGPSAPPADAAASPH
jgi:gamma-glutamyltranspeptidase/glutathione hydrolase